jgi:hypothetical protein
MTSKDKKGVRANVIFTNSMLSAEGGATPGSLGRAMGARSLRGGVLGYGERCPGDNMKSNGEMVIFSASTEYAGEWSVG